MNATTINRRRFLKQTGCSLMSSVPVLNMLLNLKLANKVAAVEAPTDYRTLVCIFLYGGNDSFNWLVPRDDARHATYVTARDNLALAKNALLPLNQDGGDNGQPYGIHPQCAGLQEMFNGMGGDTAKRRAAFIANIGTLIQPVSKAHYLAEDVPLPRALYSHSDQTDQWQTSVPQGMTQLSGWAGRAADILNSTVNSGGVSMNISMAGNNLFQVGNETTQFVVTDRGALTFTGSEAEAGSPLRLKNSAQRSIIGQTYSNLMQQSYAQLTKKSIELQEFFLQQFNSYDDSPISSLFPSDNYLAQQFLAAAKMVALRQALGLHRQTLFLTLGGWDHHTALLASQDEMFPMLDGALMSFQRALDQLGLQDSVITFSASDFGRTLRSNGNGTDHAWGGNSIVMGGPIQGGRVYGTFPDLTLDSNDDTGYGGRLIPTTAVDQLFAEMLRWFGVPSSSMSYVLPNISNFYDPSSSTLPIGFLRPGTWV